MQTQFDVIIVGGGIIGCSLAYHLATEQNRSVCLLERNKLTSGTTWHAAGLVAELRASANLTRLAKYSGELYEKLQDNGEPLGFQRVGALTLATNPDRQFELLKQAAMARANGINCNWLAQEQIQEQWSDLYVEDLVGGVYMPNDGQTNPVDTTMALARLAKQAGAVIHEDTAVTNILTHNNIAVGVALEDAEIFADQVVLCAGLWTRELGLQAGANFPLYPAEHFYAVTESASCANNLPIVRVPDHGIYIKPDAGRLLVGCFERDAKPIDPSSLDANFSFAELPFDLEHFAPYLQNALLRVPAVETVGIRTWFNGPESFTPDGRYMLGESPEVGNLFVAAGFNSIGIQSAGGVGHALAQWIVNKQPPLDLWEVDVRRFYAFQNETDYLKSRTSESLGLLYAMHWPYYQHESARNIRQSPIYEQTKQQGACFGELAGWERPNWYSSSGSSPQYDYTYAKPNWFDNTAQECQAVREDVALFDQSSFAKYLVRGVDACKFLNFLCTANVDVEIGQLVYCQWLNPLGGIEADVTVTRLHEGIYWVVSAAASATRDLHWMHKHMGDYRIQIDDITERYGVLGIMGPNARRFLQQHTNANLAHHNFAFGTSQQIEIAGCLVRASRITYVGSLGWELYIPWEQTVEVYNALTQKPIQHAGYHAMDSLRMEKGYRHWGHDLTDEDTLLEAGLSFTADFDTEFIGKQALLNQKEQGLSKRLVLFQLEDADTMLTHDEPIWRDNQIVGSVTSSAYSHTYQCSLGFGYIHTPEVSKRAALLEGDYKIEVADNLISAKPHLKAIHDPDNSQIHC